MSRLPFSRAEGLDAGEGVSSPSGHAGTSPQRHARCPIRDDTRVDGRVGRSRFKITTSVIWRPSRKAALLETPHRLESVLCTDLSSPLLGSMDAWCSGALSLPDAKDPGATVWTGSPSRRTAILEGDLGGTADLSLGSALKTVCLHRFTSLGSK